MAALKLRPAFQLMKAMPTGSRFEQQESRLAQPRHIKVAGFFFVFITRFSSPVV
jgi:hypothetical protein